MSDALRKRHPVRWALPLASAVPLALGLMNEFLTTGPGDQKAGAVMGIAFIFFPVSFILAAFSAMVTRLRWRDWTTLDKIIGLSPLLLFTLIIAAGVVTLFLGS